MPLTQRRLRAKHQPTQPKPPSLAAIDQNIPPTRRPRNRREFFAWNDRMAQTYSPADYHRHRNPFIRWLARQRVASIRRLLSHGPHHRIVELGCGAGDVLQGLMAGDRYGIDLSPWVLQQARQLAPDVSGFVQADAERLPVASGAADRVICTEVLEHVMNPDAVLREMRRVLKDDGLAVASIPNDAIIDRLKRTASALGLRRLLRPKDSLEEREAVKLMDEWHLHEFDLGAFASLLSRYFTLLRTVVLPVRPLPLHYLFVLRPKCLDPPSPTPTTLGEL